MSEHRSRSKWDRPDDLDPVAAASAAAAAINAKLGGSGGGSHREGGSSHRESGHHLSGQLVHKIDINNVKNRYSLTRGATQQEIAEQTGADVTTRGKYYPDPHMATDREPALHLVVTATDQSKLDAAIARINELIDADYVPTTGRMRGGYERDRYDQRDQRDQRDYRGGDRDGRDGGRDMRDGRDGRDGRDMRDGGGRYGGGGGGGGGYERSRRFHEDRVEVDLPDSPHYNIRAKIVGPQGAFVKYINNVSGCRVQVRGRGSGFVEYDTGVESSEPLYIHLSAHREDQLQRAIKLSRDLVETLKRDIEVRNQRHSGGAGATGANADNYAYSNYDYQQYYDQYGGYYGQQGGYDQYYQQGAYPEGGAYAQEAAPPPPPPAEGDAPAEHDPAAPPPPPPPSDYHSVPPPPSF